MNTTTISIKTLTKILTAMSTPMIYNGRREHDVAVEEILNIVKKFDEIIIKNEVAENEQR